MGYFEDVLFQNQKKDVIISEAYRVLKEGGKMIVVEWNQTHIGPDMHLRVKNENEIKKGCLKSGDFRLKRSSRREFSLCVCCKKINS